MKNTFLALFAVLITFLIQGCATTPSSPKEIAEVAPYEGVVVVSFLIKVEDPKLEQEGGLFGNDGLFGPKKAISSGYKFRLRPNDGFLSYSFGGVWFSPEFAPNEEFYFIKKMSAGRYVFDNVFAQNAPIIIPYFAPFEVKRGEATYLGQVEIKIPGYLKPGARLSIATNNRLEEAIAKLARDYPGFSRTLTPKAGL